eukprot:1316865-Rhodomonas_salina.6
MPLVLALCVRIAYSVLTLGYAATRCPVLIYAQPLFALRIRYEKSDTDPGCTARTTRLGAENGRFHVPLLSGTDFRAGGSPFSVPLLHAANSAIGLCARYGMSGTDGAYTMIHRIQNFFAWAATFGMLEFQKVRTIAVVSDPLSKSAALAVKGVAGSSGIVSVADITISRFPDYLGAVPPAPVPDSATAYAPRSGTDRAFLFRATRMCWSRPCKAHRLGLRSRLRSAIALRRR